LGHRGGASRRIPARPAARLAGEVGNNDRELTTGLLVVDLGSGASLARGTTETSGGDREEDCSGELLAGEHARAAQEASRCPRGGLGGWDIPRSWRKKGPMAVASNGGRWCAARCPAATREAGKPCPLNTCSCLGEGVTASARGDHRSQDMGGGAAATCVRAGTAATPLLGRRKSVSRGP
jgi:hypothetical protein